MTVQEYYYKGEKISQKKFLCLCAEVGVRGNQYLPTIDVLVKRAATNVNAKELLKRIDVIVE